MCSLLKRLLLTLGTIYSIDTVRIVDEHLEDYLESIKRIKEAIEKLQDLKYTAGDASMIGLVKFVGLILDRKSCKKRLMLIWT